MIWRRTVGVVAAFAAMSGNVPGSDPETRRQIRWSELKELIGGKKVALQLSDGARVEGQIRNVMAASFVFKAKKSSDPAEFPKGKIEIARDNVSRIEVRGLQADKVGQNVATVGTFVGTLLGSVVALKGGKVHEGSSNIVIPASVAIATGAAVLVYRGLAPKKVTIIEILPDSVGERQSKPINKHQSSTPPASEKALPLSLLEESSLERFRRQARRAVMRQDPPLDLSSWAVHEHRSGID